MDLIPGLPNEVVRTHILSRASWKDLRSMLAVSRIWRSTLNLHPSSSSDTETYKKTILATIHPSQKTSSCSSPSYAVSIYDLELEKWERLPAIPWLPFGAPMAARCVYLGGHLFILGGRNPITWDFMSDVFSINFRSRERLWKRCASMTSSRSSFACVAIADKIFVAGGQGESSLALASAEVYDLRCQRWEKIPELSLPRNECFGAIIHNQIVVVGGYTTSVCDASCSEDSETVITRWVASADAIQLGYQRWRTVDAASLKKDLYTAPSIGCGQLQFVHKRLVEHCYDRCDKKWTVVEGKIMLQTVEDRTESLVLAGVIEGAHIFGTKHSWLKQPGDGLDVRLSFCEAVSESAHNMGAWKEILCPFEFGTMPVSCCLIQC
ncbi:hypothetical protein O6H91_11G035600 [Diphasiastrum complanatum]|uniref:Uncharacterized protein n=1 Tax=Diphasiastrum complanatum TaxID=34168 RepID=A0ACC2C7V7_DIPCM|nr:hypothetical protein O6H91_11G035600 [Diphasiastrum complanatum]